MGVAGFGASALAIKGRTAWRQLPTHYKRYGMPLPLFVGCRGPEGRVVIWRGVFYWIAGCTLWLVFLPAGSHGHPPHRGVRGVLALCISHRHRSNNTCLHCSFLTHWPRGRGAIALGWSLGSRSSGSGTMMCKLIFLVTLERHHKIDHDWKHHAFAGRCRRIETTVSETCWRSSRRPVEQGIDV